MTSKKRNAGTVTKSAEQLHMHLRAERAVPALALEPGDNLHIRTATTPDGRLTMALDDGQPVDMDSDDMQEVRKALANHALEEVVGPTIDDVRRAIENRAEFLTAAIKAEIANPARDRLHRY